MTTLLQPRCAQAEPVREKQQSLAWLLGKLTKETDNWKVLFYPISPPAFCIDMMAGAAAAILDHEVALKVESMY